MATRWWTVPQIWKNEECWIIGGGISIPRQFGVPEETIQKVATGKFSPYAYREYLSALEDKNVIGVNKAYLLGSLVDAVVFGDPGFFGDNKQGLRSFPGTVVCCSNLSENETDKVPSMKVVKEDLNNGIQVKERDRVLWNGHSGGAAINLAALFGVKRIYLLGYDMNADSDGLTHWHGEYKGSITDKQFIGFLRSFTAISRDAKKFGIEIINVSPGSAIDKFKKASLNSIL